jgi:hypothetical protein
MKRYAPLFVIGIVVIVALGVLGATVRLPVVRSELGRLASRRSWDDASPVESGEPEVES